MKILNTSGSVVASYSYDAWGKVTTSSSIGQTNPIRYRGYYYDTDTGFYYLQSRYYDPVVKRFISADDASFLGANGDFTSLNLYAYCGNNPVIRQDTEGEAWHILTGALVGAGIGFFSNLFTELTDNKEGVDLSNIIIATTFGALGGAVTAMGLPNTVVSVAMGAFLGGTEEFTKQLFNKEMDMEKIIISSIAGGFGALFSGNGALKDINQYNYIKSQKNIYKKALSNGKSKEMAKSYYRKMTKTIYKIAHRQAARKVAISSGIAITTGNTLNWFGVQ